MKILLRIEKNIYGGGYKVASNMTMHWEAFEEKVYATMPQADARIDELIAGDAERFARAPTSAKAASKHPKNSGPHLKKMS